jgi:hypothetical protein
MNKKIMEKLEMIKKVHFLLSYFVKIWQNTDGGIYND